MIPLLLFVAITQSTGTVQLPAGRIEVPSELTIPSGAHDLTITGDHTVLHASAGFHGRAILTCQGCRNINIRDLEIDGNRAALEKPMPLAPSDVPFARFFPNNGVLIEDSEGVSIDHVAFKGIANFAVIVSHSRHVLIDQVSVEDSGSRNVKGRNNSSGGILLEQGTSGFTVTGSTFHNIRGNAVWTHSCYQSPRNAAGRIADNRFFEVGRDAIQVGHTTGAEVVGNTGERIGFPVELVDVENAGTPVGIDTAGNVDRSVYDGNHFTEVNGKCIDLDGFHDGVVRRNTCVNRGKPEDYLYGNFGISLNNTSIEMQSRNITIEDNVLEGMKFGGIFVIGSGHTIRRNQMRHLNTAHCNETHARFGCLAIAGEPEFLDSGIYLGRRGERPDPVHNVTIENNTIAGYNMAAHCIEAAPGVKLADNTIRGNRCTDE